MQNGSGYKAIVVGASAGGLQVLSRLLRPLSANFPLPILLVQHRHREQKELFEEVLQTKCALTIKQADEKEPVIGGVLYAAPPDYHLLIESDFTLALTVDPHVGYSRPSIDVLFQSAAEAYGSALVGIILTGANSDGASGIKSIHEVGGMTLAQDPSEAPFPIMPQAAIQTGCVRQILSTDKIAEFLVGLQEKAHG